MWWFHPVKVPLPTKGNNHLNITSVGCTFIPVLVDWDTICVAFGVTSNRTTKFVNAYNGLKDADGVSALYWGYIYDGNPNNKASEAYVSEPNAAPLVTGLCNGSKMRMECVVNGSKLKGSDQREPKYIMVLPTNIAGITHWCFFVSLYNNINISNINIK